MEGNPGEDAQSSAPSESFHTIPIYNFDASSDSDSDNSDRFRATTNDDTVFGGSSSGGVGGSVEPQSQTQPQPQPQNLSIMSQRPLIQPPVRSFTMPQPHQRQNSDLSESVQTRPSIDEELLFEEDEESEEEVYDPNVLQLAARPTDVINLPKTPLLVASPGTTYETPNIAEVPEIRQRDSTGLRPLSLLSGSVIGVTGGADAQTKSKSTAGSGRSREIHGGKHSTSESISKKEYDSIDEKYRKRSKDLDYRDSSDLLPLRLDNGGGIGGNAGGLIFTSNYAYLAAPFGRVISRNQIMSRIVWFSTLVFFNIIYAGYKLIHSQTTKTTTSKDNEIEDGKSENLNFVFLVTLPLIFFVLYIIFVTIWTYLDLRKKDFDPTFTVLYYSPFMLFSLFFKEKKRVDVSEFHEVNYGAQWWKFGTSRVREGLVMTIYSLLLMCFVLSDLVSSAVGQPNAEVSEVFKDFVPISFMLVVFFLGFVLSIWSVVEAVVGGGILGNGEGRKRLVGVLPYAFKRKKSTNR